MSNPEVENSAQAFVGALSSIRVDTLRFSDGTSATREIVEHPDAVGIVALDDDGRILLLEQYRHAVGGRVLEIPAGKLDEPGEHDLQAAQRELQEETGYAAQRWSRLTAFHNSAGWTNETTMLYLADDLQAVGMPEGFTARHEEAELEVRWVPLDEAVAMVATGEIKDAKTIVGVLLVRLQRGVH